MKWNWEQKDWPNFCYKKESLEKLEENFLYHSGLIFGAYKHINNHDKESLLINLMSDEALKTSEIEGEYLNRESLQSSIRLHFGLSSEKKKIPPAEQGISDMMIELYQNFKEPLTHQILFNWHKMIVQGRHDLHDIGCYRTHAEPMQVVSGSINKPNIHFEAPPSSKMQKEMQHFIEWFNNSAPKGKNPLPILTRAAIAHLYFVSIHPFEDGNGRIARALVQKSLSQSLGEPALIALSTVIQDSKRKYYNLLELSNKNNEITQWLIYFSEVILSAQNYSYNLIIFLIEKAKFYDRLRGKLNPRQEKIIARIFAEGPSGFKGGVSAENYIAITGTSKATATRDLQDLVTKDALTRTGELKSTRYWLNISL